MLSRFLHYFLDLLPTNKTKGLTLEDMNRLDVAYDEDLTIFDLERMQLEDGEVVGTTAVVEDHELVLTGGKLPSGADPMFDEDKAAIISAAKCTSLVLLEESHPDGTPRKFYGTAFFVSENLLLTAGHNTLGVHGVSSQIRITTPGLDLVQPWQVNQRKVPTIICKVAGTIYRPNGPFSNDIAILDSGTYRNSSYLSLSSAVPQIKSKVDVIGYPGYIKHEWIEAHVGVNDFDRGQKEAEKLLPKGRLTVTRGTLENVGPTIPYKASTCPGMSGSCVLYKGAVVGVHVGQVDKNPDSLPMAVSFIGDEVAKFLHRHNLAVQ